MAASMSEFLDARAKVFEAINLYAHTLNRVISYYSLPAFTFTRPFTRSGRIKKLLPEPKPIPSDQR